MRERHRNYELMFIISSMVNAEEDVNAMIGRVQETIASLGGEVTSVNNSAPWGRRKFAYPIRKYAEGEASRRSFTEGHYVMCYFSLGTAGLPELERSLKLNDLILRYMLLVVEHKGKSVAVAADADEIGVVLNDEDSASDEETEETKETEEIKETEE